MDGIEPAHLSFLSIYSPSLGTTDETEDNQILYYYASKASKAKRAGRKTGLTAAELQHEEHNEQMRQIGLAQGMVGFARSFSDNQSVDYVDTEKCRLWMHELEPGWWMVASIELTRIESRAEPSKNKTSTASDQPKVNVEYSARELCPQGLLREQFLRAHSVFILHQGGSLADIYARRGRQKLCTVLERFWNRFLRQWDVLMNGTPATDIFNGLKLAAGGELGIGVGEEEWGSGERAVLEDLVHNTDGLVDVIVSRFGEPPELDPKRPQQDPEVWLGTGKPAAAGDGVVFSGVGAITRDAARKTSVWMEWIVRYGLATYGIAYNPQSTRKRARPRRKQPAQEESRESSPERSESVAASKRAHSPPAQMPKGIPPPLVSPNERQEDADGQGLFDAESMVKYMTLGIYGSTWGIPSGRPGQAPTRSSTSKAQEPEKPPAPKPQTLEDKARVLALTRPDVIRGCFVIGMQGDLHDNPGTDISERDTDGDLAVDVGTGTDGSVRSGNTSWERRLQLRSLYIERATNFSLQTQNQRSKHSHNIAAVYDHLRVVVYARQPFLYTFLFDPARATGLEFPRFYRKLHSQLAPLYKPLVRTTSPEDVRRRLWEAAGGSPTETALASSTAPIYDLVFDPANGTCHTTLPGIPEPGEGVDAGGAPWSRADAIAVHALILRIWMDTRRRGSELERTARTTRGWWVVWMRLPSGNERAASQATESARGAGDNRGSGSGSGSGSADTTRPGSSVASTRMGRHFREAFLVRRAPEKGAVSGERRRTSSGMWGMGLGMGMGGGSGGKKEQAEDPGRLAEGIGIDTRRYVEGLLSLNR